MKFIDQLALPMWRRKDWHFRNLLLTMKQVFASNNNPSHMTLISQ